MNKGEAELATLPVDTLREIKREMEATVRKTRGGCWLWPTTGGRYPHYFEYEKSPHYGIYKRPGFGTMPAHRASWIVFNGKPIPSGAVMRHACDVRNCINPTHLTPGTHQENMNDIFNYEPLPALTEDQTEDIWHYVDCLGMTWAEAAETTGLPEIDIRNCILGLPKGQGITYNDIRKFESRYLVEHTGCWVWLDRNGNPATTSKRMRLRLESGEALFAHRLSYEIWVGDLPKSRRIFRKCLDRACVNPEHLDIK